MADVKDAREGHRRRLREKFLEEGLEKLTDAEILELLLTFGTPRRDCKLPARDLLKRFGTFRDVIEAPPEALAETDGVGPANVVAVKFFHAVAGKYLEQRLLGRSYLHSSAQVREYLRHSLESLDKELFKVIFLDAGNGVLALEDLSLGSLAGAHVYQREVMERALALKSAGLVFVHNHPSGNVDPSNDDQRLTRRLVHAAYLIEIKVNDHIIIGPGGAFFSFRDNGFLSLYEQEMQVTYQLPARPSGGVLHESNNYVAITQRRSSRR